MASKEKKNYTTISFDVPTELYEQADRLAREYGGTDLSSVLTSRLRSYIDRGVQAYESDWSETLTYDVFHLHEALAAKPTVAPHLLLADRSRKHSDDLGAWLDGKWDDVDFDEIEVMVKEVWGLSKDLPEAAELAQKIDEGLQFLRQRGEI